MVDTVAAPQPEASERITVHRPSRGLVGLKLHEIWHYRELLTLLVWRNIIVRYKQSVAGVGWAIARPVISVGVFTLIFGNLVKVPTGDTPYAIFNLVGLLPWYYFSGCLTMSSNSLVANANIATKVYFPRLLLPLSTLFTGLVDFVIGCVVLAVMLVIYREHVTLTWGVACLPAFLLLAMLVALAVGLWLGALMVRYRDVKHVLPFFVQCWMFLTPVVYSAKDVKGLWLTIYSLNPMVGVVNGFRWAVLGEASPNWHSIGISAGVTLVTLVTGLYYFRWTEKSFADIV